MSILVKNIFIKAQILHHVIDKFLISDVLSPFG